jgi:hypothetical protein
LAEDQALLLLLLTRCLAFCGLVVCKLFVTCARVGGEYKGLFV